MHSPYFGLSPPYQPSPYQPTLRILSILKWDATLPGFQDGITNPKNLGVTSYHHLKCITVKFLIILNVESEIKKPSWKPRNRKDKQKTHQPACELQGFGWIFGSPIFHTNTKGCKSFFSDVSPVPTRLHPRKRTCPLKKNQAISEGNESSSNHHFFRGHLFVFGAQSSVSPAAPPAVPSMARLVLWTPERDVPQLLRK